MTYIFDATISLCIILADVSFSNEGLALISVLVTALVSAITFLFRLAYSAKVEECNSWRQMYFTSMEYIELMRRENRERTGEKAPKPLAPVVPESSSPPTKKQIATAKIATERARLTALGVELGVPVELIE